MEAAAQTSPFICPECQCPDVYKEKRFPKKLGIAVILVAAVTSFWTYNLSWIGAIIIDGVLFLVVPTQLVCYRCKMIFRDVEIPKEIKVHNHHKAEKYR